VNKPLDEETDLKPYDKIIQRHYGRRVDTGKTFKLQSGEVIKLVGREYPNGDRQKKEAAQ